MGPAMSEIRVRNASSALLAVGSFGAKAASSSAADFANQRQNSSVRALQVGGLFLRKKVEHAASYRRSSALHYAARYLWCAPAQKPGARPMPFDHGNVSFTICSLPKKLTLSALDSFAEHKAKTLKHATEEPHYGWVTGRHLLDTNISENTAILGGHLFLQLQSAVRKVPSALFKAECRMRELTYMEDQRSEFVPRKIRTKIKDDVRDQLLPDMPPTVTGIPFVIDDVNEIAYVGATSPRQLDRFNEQFYETLSHDAAPLTPDFASDILFSINADTLYPLFFSTAKGEADGFFGRDFATWIWYFQEMERGVFEVDDYGEFSIAIDGPLTFAADGPGALESVVRKGVPTASAEAKAALSVGKKIRACKITLVRDREIWTFTLDADNFAFKGVNLPQMGEAMDKHSVFEERIMALTIMRNAFFTLFKRYLDIASDKKKAEALNRKLQDWVENLSSR
jgi:hypothetical protein